LKGGAIAIDELSSVTFNSTFPLKNQKRILFDSNVARLDPKTGSTGSAIYVKSSGLTLRDVVI
jgi:hypothetical protein